MLATKYLRKKSIKITNSVVTVGINIWGYILPRFLYICIGNIVKCKKSKIYIHLHTYITLPFYKPLYTLLLFIQDNIVDCF